jgi:hypothetical protein
MTTPSPSEFLTFVRHVTVRSSLRQSTIYARPTIVSRLAVTQKRHATAGVKTDQYEQGKKDHVVDKSGLDVQSDAANKAKS